MQDGGHRHVGKISSGDISATGRPIYFMFCSRVRFSMTADIIALFSIRTNSRWRPPPSWIISNGYIHGFIHGYIHIHGNPAVTCQRDNDVVMTSRRWRRLSGARGLSMAKRMLCGTLLRDEDWRTNGSRVPGFSQSLPFVFVRNKNWKCVFSSQPHRQ